MRGEGGECNCEKGRGQGFSFKSLREMEAFIEWRTVQLVMSLLDPGGSINGRDGTNALPNDTHPEGMLRPVGVY